MKCGLLVFLTVCVFAASMVPLERRALAPNEEPVTTTPTPNTTTKTTTTICAAHTPCAWSVYKSDFKIVEYNINNTYCVCGPDTTCQFYEDDSTVYAYIYRCRAPEDSADS